MYRLYCRVSTKDQNCELQLGELRRYCSDRDVAYAEYVDAGFSGGRADRPQLKRLMADVHRGDVVIVHKLDRFGRSVLHLKRMLDQFKTIGVRFIAVTQGVDTGGDASAASGFFLNVLASVAEFELELIKERTLLGVNAAKAAGKEIGRPRRAFRRDEAIRLRHAGASWRSIARELGTPVSTVIDAVKPHVGAR